MPSAFVLQLTPVLLLLTDKALGAVIVVLVILIQLLASVSDKVYTAGARLLIVLLVSPFDHKKVYG